MNKIILIITILIIFITSLLCNVFKKEKFTIDEGSNNLQSKVDFIKTKLDNLPSINIKNKNIDINEIVKKGFEKYYRFDLDSLRNLSFISKELMKNGVNVPGNLKVNGEVIVGSESYIKKRVSNLRSNIKILDNKIKINKRFRKNPNVNSYYFFKKWPNQIGNINNVQISRKGPLNNFSFVVAQDLKDSILNITEKNKAKNNKYLNPDKLINKKDIKFNKPLIEAKDKSDETYYEHHKLAYDMFNKYNMYIILNKTYYGPFNIMDIPEWPNFIDIYKWIDLTKRW